MKNTNPLISILFIVLLGVACQEQNLTPTITENEEEDSQEVTDNENPADNSFSFIGTWQTDSLRDVYVNSDNNYDTIYYEGAAGDGFRFYENEIEFTVFSDTFIREYEKLSEDSLKIIAQNEQRYIMHIDTLNETNMTVTEIYEESLDFVSNKTFITHYLTKVE